MTDGITLAYRDPHNRGRRVEHEPRSIGGWDRVVSDRGRDRGEWRTTGREIVTDLCVEVDAGLVADSVATDGVVEIRQNRRHGATGAGP